MPKTATRQTLDLRRDFVKPLPKQAAFLDAMYQAEYVLFGGSAGGGKTHILRWAGVELLLHWAQTLGLREVRVGLFCEDYPSLKDRHISKISTEFPRWLGELKETAEDGLCYFLRPSYGAGKIALRNLDDPAKYQSTEFAAILVDELTRNERPTFDALRFRKRWPGINHSPFLAGSNPGGRGHQWVKKLWLDRDFSGDDALLDASTFLFIPSRAKDNPHLPPSYWQTLHSLPPMMRKAMEEGSWELFAGQYFSDWNTDRNVCAPFQIPASWRRLISVDYGYSAPSAVGWWAIDGEGDWTLYRELYQTGLTYAALAREILERTPLDEMIHHAIADPAIWGDRPRTGEEIGDSGGAVLDAAFAARDIPLLRGNHDRLQGWQRCRELLKPVALPDGKMTSKLQVFSTCSQFIRTLPSLIHDETRVEDLDTQGEDHHADAWRYAVNTEAQAQRQETRSAEYEDAIATVAANGGYGFV